MRVFVLLLLAGLYSPSVQAVRLREVAIEGVDPVLAANVRAHLSIERLDAAHRADLSESRLSYYLRAAPKEAQLGLEPFGYYDAEVEADILRGAEGATLRLRIRPGEAVRVRTLEVAIQGPAREDPSLADLVARFRPGVGDVLDHQVYEADKAGITRALGQRGYFDSALAVHRIEVTRAAHAADVALAWNSGPRYGFGEARFEGHPFRPGLLEQLVPWRTGEPFDQSRLLRLQQSLTDLDYFSAISIQPLPDQQSQGQVPIQVALVPAKRSVYRAGVSYGTDTGAGVDLGLERRWLNARGHKLLLGLSVAQERSDISGEYRVPAFGWIDGWYTIGVSLQGERTNDIDTQYLDLALTRSGRLRDWNLLGGLNFRRERFDSLTADPPTYEYSTVVYPSLWAEHKQMDEPNAPRRGHLLVMELRAGAVALGSDLNFLQLRAEGHYIRAFGDANRILLRGELGTTVASQFEDFPPSLRFYAGGDRSVRGYGYKEIGERVDGVNVGGKYLAVASIEYERMFTPTWGGVVFVDAGDAFNEQFRAKLGYGIGVRWRSPVGPIRVDLAHGTDASVQGVRLHVSIGPDL